MASERRPAGLKRLEQALAVLVPGSQHLVVLGPLGHDVGSVAQGEIRRIERARDSGSLLATELAARHLAARLRRPSPSFSSAGGGGVESGSGSAGDQGCTNRFTLSRLRSGDGDADSRFARRITRCWLC